MKQLAASTHFQKQLKKLPSSDRQATLEALKGFLSGLTQGVIPPGYGFKKINGDKYEVRVGVRLRIVMKADGDTLVCHLVGNHDEVKRYLRAYRNK